MPTPRKIVQVADLTVKMQKMQAVIVADYRGITVAEITKLRNKLRPLGGEFVIGNGDIEPALYGPTALCFAYTDAAAVAKALKEYNATAKKLTFRGGLLGNVYVPGDASIDVIGSMPTRLEALAQILGVVQAPVAGIVNVLNSAATSVVYAVQARIDKMEAEKAA
jgi:large subunit ribosomal protein L10